jgi:hypothetical protein
MTEILSNGQCRTAFAHYAAVCAVATGFAGIQVRRMAPQRILININWQTPSSITTRKTGSINVAVEDSGNVMPSRLDTTARAFPRILRFTWPKQQQAKAESSQKTETDHESDTGV